MDVQYQYRFLDVVLRNGEIAIWNKLRVAKSEKLFRKKYSPTENPQYIAEQFIDQYWQENLNFEFNETSWQVIKGLQQNHDLRESFIKTVFDLTVQYQKQWQQEVYFRFGITGNLKDGKSGKPNYQIESEDGQHQAIFRHNGEKFTSSTEDIDQFKQNNISARFSIAQLKQIWFVY